jgi:hypothetical protein
MRCRSPVEEPFPFPPSGALTKGPPNITMKLLSNLFWGLVLVTAGVSYRWGSMIGLIFFVFTLMIVALVASHLRLQ